MKTYNVVLITGGSGMIAQELSSLLEQNGYEVRFLSRSKKTENHYVWKIKSGFIDRAAFKDVNHIIHLAGANISDKRWTKKQKKEILESRTDSTQLLFDTINNHQIKLDTFIATSAVGYYGTQKKDIEFTEDSPVGTDFLATVCNEWERISDNFKLIKNTRVVTLRLGVVLSKDGGAFEKMTKPILVNVGAALGSGEQYIPWIHLNDLCLFMKYVIENKAIEGIYNVVAPEHITNTEFTNRIAQKLNKKIWLPNIPSFILKLILGEMATIVLNGNKVSSKKLQSTAFEFNYPTVEKALNNLIDKKKSG